MTRPTYHQSFSCLFGEWDQFDRRISTATAPWTRLKDCTMILAFIASFILGSFGKTGAFGIISIQAGMILVIKDMRGSLRRPSLNFSHFQHQIRLDTRKMSNQTPFRRPQKYEKQVACLQNCWDDCTDLFVGILQSVHCMEIYIHLHPGTLWNSLTSSVF